ncbi:hypothetical protein BJ944DRAFT_172698 [Cunninghamella echinulata]|nr:hypothetical protein BJ944DRAFT_172698 [Cunninghamella echinulata]
MGVQGLWTLLSPAARPVQLESLRNRKLAIDASIWIHQFMRTMRSEDGQVLTNGHVLGFFRRICKLLFYNIKPVFVFDGGAPSLKISTIRERRKRREGIQTNIQRTAKKILKVQMKQRLVIEEKRRRNNQNEHGINNENQNYTPPPLEHLDNSEAIQLLRHQNTIKQDQYDLPPTPHENEQQLKNRIKKDLRLATNEELQDFIDEFKPSDIDMDSATFHALPTEIQYEIIQDLKLKSRQTSWDRLNNMIRHSSTAMDFSKQQILQLKHRNEMTQRVLKMNDMVGQDNNSTTSTTKTMAPSRIASERGKAYLLVKNEKIEEGLGWKLPGSITSSSTGLTNEEVEIDKEEKGMKIDIFKEEEGGDESEEDEENNISRDEFDPVANAVKNNPALSSLMEDFFNKEDNDGIDKDESPAYKEEEFEEYDSDDDDLPLFINPQPNQYQRSTDKPNEDSYIYEDEKDDEIAINQVLFKMYNSEHQDKQLNGTNSPLLNDTDLLTMADNENNNNNQQMELELLSEELYQLWLSRMPDAFIYLHSFNEEYKNILKTAIDNTTKVSELEQQLKSVQKSFGKSNENDAMAQESLGFHLQFLKNVILWKKHNEIQFDDNNSNDLLNTVVTNEQQQDLKINTMEEDKDQNNTMSKEQTNTVYEIQTSQLKDSNSTGYRSLKYTDKLTPIKNITTNNDNSDKIEIIKEDMDGDNIAQKETSNLDIIDNDHDDDETNMEINELEEKINMEKKELEEIKNIGYMTDDELIQHAEDEDAEYARFISDIASRDLDTVKQELANDIKELNQQQYKQLGNADTITDQMIHEIQELLQLFGIPYLVSPMEAEAQCSFLLENKLVDGVVTDDSDVFLFGGTRIYKNMFHQQKYVECYLLNDIDREMQLDRKKLIQLAYLLGSDYTSGISGIGPVTAMEILSIFQEYNNEDDVDDGDDGDSIEGPLSRFKKWYESGIDDTDFQKKMRNKLKHIDIPDDFPNPLIKNAYIEPVVDKSLENFVWLPPQLDSLRIYLMKSFSWSQEKADEVLIPVIREVNQNKIITHQPTINSYFDVSAGLSTDYSSSHKRKHKSKRVQNVVDRFRQQKRKKT